jgi:hypothetical protein
VEATAERFAADVDFLLVYVREAHPEDAWVLEENREQGIRVADPRSHEEREACALRLERRIPVLVDDLDDGVARAYGGWPERLYLVDRDGRIAYQGGRGPFEFFPHELEQAIERLLGARQPEPSSPPSS